MNQVQYNQLFAFIWNIANDVLVHAFNKGDYKKVILPMMVLRRLDILLEPTHEAVLKLKKDLEEKNIPEASQEQVLFGITGHPFCNTSRFTMKSLRGETNPIRLKQNFLEYLDGFSRDVQDIIEKFKLKQQVDNLSDAGRLGSLIEKFTDDGINLGINPILDKDGNEKQPGVDNHTMGTLFEELLRKFNEENSVTEAGEHFTPRDYVALMADIAVLPVADRLRSATYKVYDGACGTGGILSIAEERIQEQASLYGKQVKIDLYGQELQPETYATCKADLMLSTGNVNMFTYKHAGQDRERFFCGSTISNDGHPGMKFDFCISNPPFGTPWKADMEAWGLKENEKDKIADRRFYRSIGYDDQIRFIPGIGDPQMLFLANNVSRINDDSELGTRIVEVHNGSSLFTGNAGGGESNLRKYIIENDMLEAIIAMPEKDFYNTGIGTFIWVVTNRKEARRRGKVQLIDATEIKTPLRKNLGEKNCETTEDDRQKIMKLLMDFEENEQSRIFPNEEFGYYEISVERPLRLKACFTNNGISACIQDKKYRDLQELLSRLFEGMGGREYLDFNKFVDDAKTIAKEHGYKWKKTYTEALQKYFTEVCPDAEIVSDESGKPISDKNLSETEQVPLLYEGGIESFMQNEVLPYTPDAYVNDEKTVIGYELSFTKYFYKPVQLRSLDAITDDILTIEKNTDGMLDEILKLKKEIAAAVTKGINPDAPTKPSGISWIGDIPAHWEVKRLGSAFIENRTLNSDLSSTEAYKFNYGALVRKDEDVALTDDVLETYRKYTVIKPNDILINGLNLNYDFVSQRVAMSFYNGIITSAYLAITPRENINPSYFCYLLKSMDAKKLFHGMGTGIRLTLSYAELKKQMILFPPLAEQEEIVNYIDQKTTDIDRLIVELTYQVEYLKEYKQSLFADVVTGKIDV